MMTQQIQYTLPVSLNKHCDSTVKISNILVSFALCLSCFTLDTYLMWEVDTFECIKLYSSHNMQLRFYVTPHTHARAHTHATLFEYVAEKGTIHRTITSQSSTWYELKSKSCQNIYIHSTILNLLRSGASLCWRLRRKKMNYRDAWHYGVWWHYTTTVCVNGKKCYTCDNIQENKESNICSPKFSTSL